MSLASKITLGASAITLVGIAYYVQVKQCTDRERMHKGVVRDREMQEKRKAENIYLLQQQEELAKILRKKNDDEEVVLKILTGDKDGKD